MKLTKDLIGKKIIRTKPITTNDKSFTFEPEEVFDIGHINIFFVDKESSKMLGRTWQPHPYKLEKWDDGNWEIYHECKHRCPFFSKPNYCPECGEKL
jgi:hypothetical protein